MSYGARPVFRTAILAILLSAAEILFAPSAWSAPFEGVTDLDGKAVDPYTTNSNVKASVFVFLAVDCPISNKYAPELRRLAQQFEPKGVQFWLVYPDAMTSAESIRNHIQQYGFKGSVVRDPKHDLVRKCQVDVTPEAAVFGPNAELIYHGRIDDRFPALGIDRSKPVEKTLREVLISCLAGKKPMVRQTRAIGCRIPAGT
jgi:hypothetical protein